MTALPDIQLVLRPGIVEVRRSKPDATLLPTVELIPVISQSATYMAELYC